MAAPLSMNTACRQAAEVAGWVWKSISASPSHTHNYRLAQNASDEITTAGLPRLAVIRSALERYFGELKQIVCESRGQIRVLGFSPGRIAKAEVHRRGCSCALGYRLF